MSRKQLALVAFAAASLACCLASAEAIPALQGRINDYAQILSPGAEMRMDSVLAKLESDKGSQVVVLTIVSLGDDALEDYSIRVAEAWEIGRGEHDDGAILLIAQNDRKMRLEVGYGLEPLLTDAMSRRILDNVIAPRFRLGDFDGGVENAVDAIDGLIRGTSSLPAPKGQKSPRLRDGLVHIIFWFMFLGFWILRGVGFRRRGGTWSSYGGGFGAGGGGGGFSGGGGSFGGGGSSGGW